MEKTYFIKTEISNLWQYDCFITNNTQDLEGDNLKRSLLLNIANKYNYENQAYIMSEEILITDITLL